MRLDEKLNRLCEARRLTNQRELAKLADVTKSSLNRWLNGKSVPDLFEAGRLARILGVPLDYLADDAQDEPPAPAELPDDERAALDMYRGIRAAVGPAEALTELADLKAETRRRLAAAGHGEQVPGRDLRTERERREDGRESGPGTGRRRKAT